MCTVQGSAGASDEASTPTSVGHQSLVEVVVGRRAKNCSRSWVCPGPGSRRSRRTTSTQRRRWAGRRSRPARPSRRPAPAAVAGELLGERPPALVEHHDRAVAHEACGVRYAMRYSRRMPAGDSSPVATSRPPARPTTSSRSATTRSGGPAPPGRPSNLTSKTPGCPLSVLTRRADPARGCRQMAVKVVRARPRGATLAGSAAFQAPCGAPERRQSGVDPAPDLSRADARGRRRRERVTIARSAAAPERLDEAPTASGAARR